MSRDPKGYYSLFGVSPDSSGDEIKRQYRKIAQQLHPDKNKSPNSTALFQYVTNVFHVLSDSGLRQDYDPYWQKFKLYQFKKIG
mgnify:CR=1 FL=1